MVAPGPSATCQLRVNDGSFEGGSPNASWSEFSTNFGTPLCNPDPSVCGTGGGTAGPRTGTWWAWYGGIRDVSEYGSVSQNVQIPAGGATLRFWVWNGASSGNGTDYFRALVDGVPVFTLVEGNPAYTSGYVQVAVDVSSFANGGTHVLLLESFTSGTDFTNFSVDDVSIEACTIDISIGDGAVVEGDAGTASMVFPVSLSQPSGASVSVNYGTAAGTATEGSDYTLTSGTASFTPGMMTQTITVPIMGDTLPEPNETLFVNLSTPLGAAITDGQGKGTILDDEPADFYSVTPCRLVDTRNPPGPSGGPILSANTTRLFPVHGLCGIPADARAVAVNITVVQPSHLGHATLFPADATVPVVSTVNFRASGTRGNNAVATLGGDGELAVRIVMGAAGSAHVVIDVFGYLK